MLQLWTVGKYPWTVFLGKWDNAPIKTKRVVLVRAVVDRKAVMALGDTGSGQMMISNTRPEVGLGATCAWGCM